MNPVKSAPLEVSTDMAQRYFFFFFGFFRPLAEKVDRRA
jgi:hypothetical protein